MSSAICHDLMELVGEEVKLVREIYRNKENFSSCLKAIDEVGEQYITSSYTDSEEECVSGGMFIDVHLCENETISVASWLWGARREGCFEEWELQGFAAELRAEGRH